MFSIKQMQRIFVFIILVAVSLSAEAVPVQFNYFGTIGDGATTYEGSMVLDDSLFDGTSSQSILQSSLLAFDMTVVTSTTTFSWDLSDLILGSSWVFDSTTIIPDIVGINGFISTTNSLSASPDIMDSSFGIVFGDWTYSGAVSTPEPTSLILMGIGLLGLGLSRRKRRQ